MTHFILSAIDPVFGCPILETLIPNPDVDVIRTLAGIEDGSDPDGYVLHPEEAAAIAKHFSVAFEPITPDILISRASFNLNEPIRESPYLIHTGLELFLMLEGTKPFCFVDFSYPVYTGEGDIEALFEPHVQSGRLIKRIVDEPYEKPWRDYRGRIHESYRGLYYSLPGEQWRIDAFLLLRRQLRFVRWDEAMERMEGSLLGYTDAQNDVWISGLRYEGKMPWGLMSAYAVVDEPALAWIRSAGCRALPWDGSQSEFRLELHWPRPEPAKLTDWLQHTGTQAVIRLGLPMKYLNDWQAGAQDEVRVYKIPREAVPGLNAALGRPVEILCERGT
jgi:hypothetical protein